MSGPETLQIGWTEELDIPSALDRLSPARQVKWSALIAMIDSTPGVRRLPSVVPLLKRLGAPYAEVGDDVAVDVPVLLDLIEQHELLDGFDEVWLFERVPSVGKPAELKITSDVPLGSETPVGLAEWMGATGCCAGLGDGDGLNWATPMPDLADLWRASPNRGVTLVPNSIG
jgi:hypothetical protein